MRKLTKYICLFIFIPSLAVADIIELRADPWCPFNCIPNSNEEGYLVDIARYSFEKLGHKVNYENLPWARAIKDGREGRINGIMGAEKLDAPDYIFPELKIGKADSCFYVKKNSSWSFKDFNSLSSIVLGVINQYSYGKKMDKYISENKGENIFKLSGTGELLNRVTKMLSRGNLDSFLGFSPVIKYHLKKKNQVGIIQNAGCLKVKHHIYIAFSPKHPKSKDYAKILTDGIRELRKSGKLKEILKKYGLKDWK